MATLRWHPITSLDLPELAPYRTLKRYAAHEDLGIFVVEGDKVLHRLLESNLTVVSLLLVEDRLDEFAPLLQARPEPEIKVFICRKEVMSALIGFKIYQGVLAMAKIPARRSLQEILAASPSPRLFVAMDGLANAENVGTLMRTSLAFGVQALIAGETSSSPYLRRTVRNSMGAAFKLPVLETANLAQTLRELRQQGIRCIAAHPHAKGQTLSQADLTGDCCVVMGSEGPGISPSILTECDEMVAIPMANAVDSINVSAAAAVFLYEASRQRNRSIRTSFKSSTP